MNIDVNVVIALIAAGSALAGAAVGQLGTVIQYWLSRRAERADRLLQRFEELANLCAEIRVLLGAIIGAETTPARQDQKSRILVAAARIDTLALSYFPEFREPAKSLSSEAYLLVEALDQENIEGAQQAARKFAGAQIKVSDLISAHAKNYD